MIKVVMEYIVRLQIIAAGRNIVAAWYVRPSFWVILRASSETMSVVIVVIPENNTKKTSIPMAGIL